MHAAFSLILLTTLIGVGQGFFLALFSGQYCVSAQYLNIQNAGGFFGAGGFVALAFLVAGLAASRFHLGRPERAWRAASQWHTCWLSREVIVLPVLMALVFAYGMIHFLNRDTVVFSDFLGVPFTLSLLIGALGSLAAIALFVCTAMIYAGINFLREWSSPWTVVNYILLGTASGFTLAACFSVLTAPDLAGFYAVPAMVITFIAFLSKSVSLLRNGRLHTESNNPFLTSVRPIKVLFMVLVFPVPIILLYAGKSSGSIGIFTAAFLAQYVGLIFERWIFFTEVDHPQNQYRMDFMG